MTGHAAFTGSVPSYYDRHLGPVLFEPYAADLVRRLPAGDGLRILELACGTGIATRRLREALPGSATLVATDLNEPMIAYARDAVALPGIEWRTADAQALPFADRSFDVVACQFGLMFLPDRAQGFREARRALAPGGRLVASVWLSADENPFVRAMQGALDRLYLDDPPRFLDTPYGYHDEGQLRTDLAAGGWERVELETVRHRSTAPSAVWFATGFVRGSPLFHALRDRGADLDAVAATLGEAMVPVGGDEPFVAELAAHVVTALR